VAAADPVALTEQYRQAQTKIRARALRDFLVLWPLWHGDSQSFQRLVVATMPLARVYQSLSATLAATYYKEIRSLEQVPGDATVRLAASVVPAQIVASMYATGQTTAADAIAAGRTATEARQIALARVSGAVTRHILDGGRDTILQSVQADKQAVGWARVTDGDPCYFCLTLASRGAVYKSEQTAGFQAHDHCGCTAMPVYKGTLIPNLPQWRDIYNRSQNEAESSGELQPGENTSKARLNAVRRYLAAHPAA